MRLRHLLLIAAVLFCPAISHAVTCSVSNVQPINLGSVAACIRHTPVDIFSRGPTVNQTLQQ